MYIASEREQGAKIDFYDLDFNHLPVKQGGENSQQQLKKPRNFDKMIELARQLSEGIPHVRVDFYEAEDHKLYFGEMTFYHNAGNVPFVPETFDEKMGALLQLPVQ